MVVVINIISSLALTLSFIDGALNGNALGEEPC